MPLVRCEVRNEVGLGDRGLYGSGGGSVGTVKRRGGGGGRVIPRRCWRSSQSWASSGSCTSSEISRSKPDSALTDRKRLSAAATATSADAAKATSADAATMTGAATATATTHRSEILQPPPSSSFLHGEGMAARSFGRGVAASRWCVQVAEVNPWWQARI